MATDESLFSNFSWRGYAVFSPIQSKVMLDVDIPKANIYRVLFRYVNPTPGPIKVSQSIRSLCWTDLINLLLLEATVSFTPYYTETEGNVEQRLDVELPATPGDGEAALISLAPADSTAPHPFVLNPGKWILATETKQRLFLVPRTLPSFVRPECWNSV